MILAFSPCPNDIFVFYNFLIANDFKYQVIVKGLEELNAMALSGSADFIKVSASLSFQLKDQYLRLPLGGSCSSLTSPNGPKIVVKSNMIESITSKEHLIKLMIERGIAIPGPYSTSLYAFRCLFPDVQNVHITTYDGAAELVLKDKVGFGVVINETRNILNDHGLHAIYDLSQLWTDAFSSALPLGCVMAKKTLPQESIDNFCLNLKDSLAKAQKNLSKVIALAQKYSVEKSEKALIDHIKTFVNEDTFTESSRMAKCYETLAKACN